MTDPGENSQIPSKFAQVVAAQQARELPPPPVSSPAGGAGGNRLTALRPRGETDGAKEQLKSIALLRVFKVLFPGRNIKHPEGVETLVSCFNEGAHANGDRNPSMSINSVNNVYKCFGCEISGDILDMTAVKYGYADQDSRCPEEKIHQAVYDASTACNTGWTFHQGSDGRYYKDKAGVDYSGTAKPPPIEVQENNVTSIHSVVPPPPIPLPQNVKPLKWREIVDSDSPIHKYMEIVSQDDCPEEYHFWNFMVLIGLICGRDAAFEDWPVVHGNLFVCLVGNTTVGKSRTLHPIKSLTSLPVLEYKEDDPFCDGIKQIRQPGSGEVLCKNFQHISPDPNWAPTIVPGQRTATKAPLVEHPVRGLITFDEIASLVSKSSSKGSTIKTTLMEIFDAGPSIGGSSLSGGSYEARDAVGSVITTTQPSIVHELFTGQDASSGFLNRWLMIHGVPKERHTMNANIDISPMENYIKDLVTWVAEIKNMGGLLDFESDEVRDQFDKVCTEYIFEQDSKNGLQRLHLMFKKFVLLMSANNLEEKISAETITSAEMLVKWITIGATDSGMVNLGDDLFERIDTEIKRALHDAGKDGLRPTDLRKRVKSIIRNDGLSIVYPSVYREAVTNNDVVELSFVTGGRGRPKKIAILAQYEKLYAQD